MAFATGPRVRAHMGKYTYSGALYRATCGPGFVCRHASSDFSASFGFSLHSEPRPFLGSLPLPKVQVSPLVKLEPNIHAKLEGTHVGGSIKDRAVSYCVHGMLMRGELKPGGTLALCTSGSAGVSLLLAQRRLLEQGIAFNVKIFMPESYVAKPIPQDIVQTPGVVIQRGGAVLDAMGSASSLCPLDGDFVTTLAQMKQFAAQEGWAILDQHYDIGGRDAHKSTSEELMAQLPSLTDVVCATGTGATAAGLREFLPLHVTVHSRPAVSGTLDGCTDVRRYNNFCDPDTLCGYNENQFCPEEAQEYQRTLREEYQIHAGPSSGAVFALAHKVAQQRPHASIAFICADGRLQKGGSARPLASRDGEILSQGIVAGGRRSASAFGRGSNGLLNGLNGRSMRRGFSTRTIHADFAVLGGGPVGASTAWKLAEKLQEQGEDKKVVMVHSPVHKGAHEDYSRLARLSFDSNAQELEVSRLAIEQLDLVDEVQSYHSGSPVIPMRPGMLFVASPGTPLAGALERGEAHGDGAFRRHTAEEVKALYPGNVFNLPDDTLCWSHPTGYCVDPIQMAETLQQMCKSYGVEVVEGWANVDVEESGEAYKLSTDDTDVVTKNCFLFPGARVQELVDLALKRGEHNRLLEMKDLQTNYITAISTVRFAHANSPLQLKYDPSEVRDVVEASGDGLEQVIPPIVLGQIVQGDLLPYTANFSIVAEELGEVYKVRLSGKAGSEVIPTVGDMYSAVSDEQNEQQMADYQRFFGALFPYLNTSKALDFNRCITYRNHKAKFNGYSLLRKHTRLFSPFSKTDIDLNLLATPGCFGVGVKFGPLLGELAADTVLGNDKVHNAIVVHEDGQEDINASDETVAAGRLAEVY